jgi:hypothetical protein
MPGMLWKQLIASLRDIAVFVSVLVSVSPEGTEKGKRLRRRKERRVV